MRTVSLAGGFTASQALLNSIVVFRSYLSLFSRVSRTRDRDFHDNYGNIKADEIVASSVSISSFSPSPRLPRWLAERKNCTLRSGELRRARFCAE